MATIITPYDHLWELVTAYGLNLRTAEIRVRMVTSGYTFDAAHEIWDNAAADATDPSHHEVANGDGYTTGGIQLANAVVTPSKISYDDVTWVSLTKTFRSIIGVAIGTWDGKVDPLLFRLLPDSTPADTVSSGSNYQIVWNATNGLFYRPAT